MHSKQKGNIAVGAVIFELQKNSFNVFIELGDYSKIDIIAEKDGILKKIQIKSCGRFVDKAELNTRKCGPNGYRYHYSENDVDWFALYHSRSGQIFWINAAEACEYKNLMTIRITPPKRKQGDNIHKAECYQISKFIAEF